VTSTPEVIRAARDGAPAQTLENADIHAVHNGVIWVITMA